MTIRKTNAEWEEILLKIKSAAEEKIVLPVSVGYKIVKSRLAVEQALAAYRISRDEIVSRHSNGQGYISEKDEKFAEVCAEIAVIAKEYAEVDISVISLSELGDKELPLHLVSALGFMME